MVMSSIVTSDFVDVLQGETKRLVDGADRGLDGVQHFQEGSAAGTALPVLHLPALEPRHLDPERSPSQTSVISNSRKCHDNITFCVGVIMFSPVQPEIGTKGTVGVS